jgi:D-sedoheptulose 7-phosphate isomerase
MTDTPSRRHVRDALSQGAEALSRLMTDDRAIDAVARAGDAFAEAVHRDGRIFACGNGGSMSDAMHFAEELSGRFRKDRRALPAVAISDPGHLTCAANDFGFEAVFSRYLEAHGRKGDALLAISTSGKSPNVLAAARRAHEIGMAVVALTGRPGSLLAGAADIEICTQAGEWSDRIQELHIKVIHILVELIERRLFPENYR